MEQNAFAVLADDQCRSGYVLRKSGPPEAVVVHRQVAQVPLAQLFLNRVRRLPPCEDPDGVAVQRRHCLLSSSGLSSSGFSSSLPSWPATSSSSAEMSMSTSSPASLAKPIGSSRS